MFPRSWMWVCDKLDEKKVKLIYEQMRVKYCWKPQAFGVMGVE